MPAFDFTFRFDAPRLADVLLTTDTFVIGTSFVEIYGERHEFLDAQCMNDECTYTVSFDEERVLFWVDFELAGIVPMTRWVVLHNTDKIVGDDVIDARYIAGVVGPQNKHLERQLQSEINCHPRCQTCDAENDPTACVTCNPAYYYYDTAQSQDPDSSDPIPADTYILCLEECGSGIFIEMTDQGATCRRPDGFIWERTIWDKFLTYGTSDALNEFKGNIGVKLRGSLADYAEITDPIPAYQRGLYFNGYSAFMTFEGLNLGTEFNIGYWCKPFHFDGLFTIFAIDPSQPTGLKRILEMNRREPDQAVDEFLSINWVMSTIENFNIEYYATSIADANFGINYQLEDVWWLLNLRVGSGYSVDEGRFASSYRIYWNNLFGGNTLPVFEDFFEDSISYIHLIGRTVNYEHFHGFISNFHFYNFATATYPELFVTLDTPEQCESCKLVCPSQPEFYDCVIRNGSVNRECRGIEDKLYCPDCCGEGFIWFDEACQSCGNLCTSCSAVTVTDGSLITGDCEYPSEYALLQASPARDAVCEEDYVHDTVNNRCCEPFCPTCSYAPFECDQCYWGYLLRDKSGFNNFGLPLLGNECIVENCINGVPSGDQLCQCPQGYHIENETCDDTNECTCTSGICTCVPIVCYEGCALCNSSDDFSKCFKCDVGYLNNPPEFTSGEFEYSYCVRECPSGFADDGVNCIGNPNRALILKFQFNFPASNFLNFGSLVTSRASLITQLPSGVPVKNRGVYFDGVNDGYIALTQLVFNHSWTITCWVFTFSFVESRQVQFQKENSFILYTEGTNMGLEIYSQDTTDTTGFTNAAMTAGLWQFLGTEVELFRGASTDIRVFLDDLAAATASVGNFLLDFSSQGFICIGRSNGVFGNRANGYLYDISVLQTSENETHRIQGRTAEGCAVNDCWDVEFNQYKTGSGEKLACSADCINGQKGCINSRECRDDCKDGGQWCHLCLDYMCWDCDTYDTCQTEGCAPNSDDLDGIICECLEPEYGRNYNIDVPCAECHDTCETCSIEGVNGCLTCDPLVRRPLDPDNVPTACICIDGLYPDPTHSDCSQCHENCATCFGGESFECHDGGCADGLYQWIVRPAPGPTILCLQECPTGYTTLETPFQKCERPTLSNWQFDYFPRQSLDIEDDDVAIFPCSVAPIPVYGRGLYFDGVGSCLEMDGINLGTEFSIQIWFRADEPDSSFNSLFSIVNDDEIEIFKIGISNTQDSIQVNFVTTNGIPTLFASPTVVTETANGNYSLTGQWNSLGYTQWAVRNQADAGRFGTECRFFINAFRPVDFQWDYGDYMEDLMQYFHVIGSTADGNFYAGHIGTINLFNFRVDDFDNIVQISTSSCPTCSTCPVAKAYTECVDDCEFDMNGTCIEDCEDLKEPICPVDCDMGNYQLEDLSCIECTEGGESCRIPQNDRVCDDILCIECFPLYGECNHPDSCVENAGVVFDDCECNQYWKVDTDNNDCIRDCDPICNECDGPDIWHCLDCATGFNLPIVSENAAGILCVDECPAGFIADGEDCVRQNRWSYVFDCFWRYNGAFDVRGITIYGGDEFGSDALDPTPVYGRGFYYAQTEYSQMINFNMGQEWTLSIWFNTADFQTIYTVYDSFNFIICLAIRRTSFSGQEVVQLQLEMKKGAPFLYTSAGQFDLAQTNGWTLDGRWNRFSLNYRSQYFEYDSVNDFQTFGMQLKMFMNEYGETDNQTVQDDCWVQDNVEYKHFVGRDGTGSEGCEGFIGDLVYGNYAYEDYLNYIESAYPNPPGCPTTVHSPESKTYIDCYDQCLADSPNDMENCLSTNCTQDPHCIDHCPIDQYMDENNNFACTDCTGDCESCRYPVTCNGCDDIRCQECSDYYIACTNEICKPNATWDDAQQICVCDFEFDETTYNCCYENCIVCSDAVGVCDECAEFWFGDFCETKCVNGTYEAGSPGSCNCEIGWSGPACDEECNPVCLTCAQDNPDLCLTCRGNKTGDLCELCIENWFPPEDCSVECVNGTYVDLNSDVPPGICDCDQRWSGSNCNTPCHPNCLTCSQDDPNQCIVCPGNQEGTLCDTC